MGSPMPSVAFSPAVTASPAIVTISIADEAAEEAKLPYRQVHSGPGTESTGTGTSSGSPLQEDLTPAPIFKGIKTPKTVSLSRTLPPVLAKQTKPGPTRNDKVRFPGSVCDLRKVREAHPLFLFSAQSEATASSVNSASYGIAIQEHPTKWIEMAERRQNSADAEGTSSYGISESYTGFQERTGTTTSRSR